MCSLKARKAHRARGYGYDSSRGALLRARKPIDLDAGDQTVGARARERRARARKRITDRGIIADRYVTVRAIRARGTAVVSPLTSIALEGRCARAQLIIGRPINTRAVLTPIREFDPVTRKHACRSALAAKRSAANDPISPVVFSSSYLLFEIFVIGVCSGEPVCIRSR